MGLFSNQCPKCGQPVKRAARFCSKCGTGAPKGWFKSPHSGKLVGNDSAFDPFTGEALAPEVREQFTGDGWLAPDGVLAQRIQLALVEERLKGDIVLQPTVGLILVEDGSLQKTLGPGGKHKASSLRGFLIRKSGNAEAILVNSGPYGLPIRSDKFRTGDDFEVSVYAEIRFTVDLENADKLLTAFLATDDQLMFDEAGPHLMKAINACARDTIAATDVETLVKNADARLAFEDKLAGALSEALGELGLGLDKLGAVEFTGPAYEQIRQQSGEAEQLRKRLEVQKRARSLILDESAHKARSEDELEKELRTLAAERDLQEAGLSHELAVVKQKNFHGLSARQQAFELEQQGIRVEKELEEEMKRHARMLEQKRAEHRDRVAQTTDWIGVKKDKERAKLDIEKERIAAFSNQDITALIAALPPERAQSLMAMHARLQEANLTPEQMLARAAANNPEAARALGQMLAANADKDRETNARLDKQSSEWAGHLEKVMRESVKAIGKASQG
ncbi:MAG: hypothetical protein ACFE0O_05415 [Opitutales bacterium]